MRSLSKWLVDDPKSYGFDPKLGLYVRQYFGGLAADPTPSVISTTPTTTPTALFSPAQAEQAFPLPFGLYGSNLPFVNQVFRFTFGGVITTPATGTLTIIAYHGPGTSTTAFGTTMATSGAQTVTASLSNAAFRVQGELVYHAISVAATSSTAFLSGQFVSQGTLATAGSGWSIPFGQGSAVSVDTTGTGTTGTFGALNFSVTFSVTGASVGVNYTAMEILN